MQLNNLVPNSKCKSIQTKTRIPIWISFECKYTHNLLSFSPWRSHIDSFFLHLCQQRLILFIRNIRNNCPLPHTQNQILVHNRGRPRQPFHRLYETRHPLETSTGVLCSTTAFARGWLNENLINTIKSRSCDHNRHHLPQWQLSSREWNSLCIPPHSPPKVSQVHDGRYTLKRNQYASDLKYRSPQSGLVLESFACDSFHNDWTDRQRETHIKVLKCNNRRVGVSAERTTKDNQQDPHTTSNGECKNCPCVQQST